MTLTAVLFRVLFGAALLGGTGAVLFPHEARIAGQVVLASVTPPSLPVARQVAASPEATSLIRAAEGQVGVTLTYDPAYTQLDYPMGDVPRGRGVCTDVLIRALRDGFGIDLQAAVHRDMTRDFAAYPAIWGLTRPDRNIDHRRVPNLEALLTRAGARQNGTELADFAPGDIVTTRLPGNRPHVVIVSDRVDAAGQPLVIHNIGSGTRLESRLFEYPIEARFRLTPAVLDRLRALAQDG